jgi:putative ABC transport system substrate-binding protein
VRRRQFITLLGGAAAWSLMARAQQPAIGFLNPQSPEGFTEPIRRLRQGLKETGYVEGENVTIEYRWADNQVARLPELATELVRRRPAVIITTGGPLSALAAKSATTAVPIVFNVAEDPVSLGLVASLARPGGNVTGVTILATELTAKRLELLRELVPGVVRVAVFAYPSSSATDVTLRELETAARAMGLRIQVLRVSTNREIDEAFATFGQERPDALFVPGEPFFSVRRVQLALLAAVHRVPSTFALRSYAEAGGLMSYGASLGDAYRQVGIYAGRVLKGIKPADLPVVQLSKFELIINQQTARILGLMVPDQLLATADEVIE